MAVDKIKLEYLINKIKYVLGDSSQDNGIVVSNPFNITEYFENTIYTDTIRIFDDYNIKITLEMNTGNTFSNDKHLLQGTDFYVSACINRTKGSRGVEIFQLNVKYGSVKRLNYLGHGVNTNEESRARGIFATAYVYSDPVFELEMHDIKKALLQVKKTNRKEKEKELKDFNAILSNIDNIKAAKLKLEKELEEISDDIRN